jgi:hypothetical protein
MTKITNVGNMPHILRSFLTGVLSGEKEQAEVFDCNYDEIIGKAKTEKLEPQVIIDKKGGTGRAYLCAVGASVRGGLLYASEVSLKPIFYYAELDDDRKRAFQASLREARAKILKEHNDKLERAKIVKANTRKAAEELRNGKTRIS